MMKLINPIRKDLVISLILLPVCGHYESTTKQLRCGKAGEKRLAGQHVALALFVVRALRVISASQWRWWVRWRRWPFTRAGPRVFTRRHLLQHPSIETSVIAKDVGRGIHPSGCEKQRREHEREPHLDTYRYGTVWLTVWVPVKFINIDAARRSN